MIEGPEECDDGNTAYGDVCEGDCRLFACSPLSKIQWSCIRAVNKGLAGVLKAQNADDVRCIQDVSSGRQPDLDACLGEDVSGKVARAQARISATDARKCKPPKGETPTLAYTDPATVSGAGRGEPLDAVVSVFAMAANVARKSSDAAGAACQAEMMKQLGAVANRWAAEANKAKARALEGGKGGPPGPAPPACSNAELAAAIDADVPSSAALAKAEARARAAVAGKCTDSQASGLFACAGATTAADLVSCVVAAAEEAACNAFEAADLLVLDCPSPPVSP